MKNYRLTAVVCLVLMGLSLLACGVGVVAGLHVQEQQYALLTTLPYDACYRFRGDTLPPGACMELNALYTVRVHGRTIKSDKLMQHASGGAGPWPDVPPLASDEVYVSANVLTLYALSVGDVLTVWRTFSSTPTEYRIVGVLPPCYGLDGVTDAARGVLLFGCDASLTAQGPFDFRIYEAADFRPSTVDGTFLGLISVRAQTRSALLELVQTLTLLWCILLISDLLATLSLFAPRRAYLRRLYCGGASHKVMWRQCAAMLFPLFLCRGWMVIFGGLCRYATGSYGFLLVNLLELPAILLMVGLQVRQIERSAS
ncbi:MAG: hypothetical protein IJY28_10100 [Clostridia bacterium]|nr:hypothetical protein [Clostridia bacterium]